MELLVVVCLLLHCVVSSGFLPHSHTLQWSSSSLSLTGRLPTPFSLSLRCETSRTLLRAKGKAFSAPRPSTSSANEEEQDGKAAEKPKVRQVKDDVIEMSGFIREALPNGSFQVELHPSKQVVLAAVSGKIRKNIVRCLVGDRVTIELSAYDLTKGRITYRHRD